MISLDNCIKSGIRHAYGKAKSSSNGVGKAKQHIIKRAHFLRMAIDSMFPGTKSVAMTGEIYVLDDAGNYTIWIQFELEVVSIQIVPNH
jgi:hypothetical protein